MGVEDRGTGQPKTSGPGPPPDSSPEWLVKITARHLSAIKKKTCSTRKLQKASGSRVENDKLNCTDLLRSRFRTH